MALMAKQRRGDLPANFKEYPSRVARTHSLAQANRAANGTNVIVVGRIIRLDLSGEHCLGVLNDQSGKMIFCFPAWERSTAQSTVRALQINDIVELQGKVSNDGLICEGVTLLAPSFEELHDSERVREVVELRSKALWAIREFFTSKGFWEVDAPLLAEAPNLEVHQEPFVTYFKNESNESRRLFLPSSPEYFLKRALVYGCEKIFTLGHVFRNGELSALHQPEFLMLEWYRAYASCEEIMDDLQDLILFLNRKLNGSDSFIYCGNRVNLEPPWEKVSMEELFELKANINIAELDNKSVLIRCLGREPKVEPGKSFEWEDAFLAVFLEKIEPFLGQRKPTFVTLFPKEMAALSKISSSNPNYAERVELYIEGIELANGYTELNDPHEQLKRFVADLERKKAMGSPVYQLDRKFLHSLKQGMPPAGGMAMGIDRLLMLLTDRASIDQVMPFPFEKKLPGKGSDQNPPDSP